MAMLTEEQIAEFREAFQLFADPSSGELSVTSLATCCRALGLNPSDWVSHFFFFFFFFFFGLVCGLVGWLVGWLDLDLLVI